MLIASHNTSNYFKTVAPFIKKNNNNYSATRD